MRSRILQPMRIVREPEGFARWWQELGDRANLAEALNCLTEISPTEVEHALHRLLLEVFQAAGPIKWLRIEGLRRGVGASYIVLDADPAYDCDGVLDGVDLVLTAILYGGDPAGSCPALRVSAHEDHPSRFTPRAFDEPATALADVLDAAIVVINQHVSEQDRFITEAREVSPLFQEQPVGPAFAVAAAESLGMFDIDIVAFDRWVSDKGEELEFDVPDRDQQHPAAALSNLVREALEAGVVTADWRVELTVCDDDEWECSGYSVVIRNRGGEQRELGLTGRWNELRWPDDATLAREAAHEYLQDVCCEANALLRVAALTSSAHTPIPS
ncbi:hypothetical protein [Mycobacterium pseudoshottsii]|nr:hypothetical protein [Mycobacterium pseudoshottsii]